jgi:CHASE3 domain sensor protein
MTSESEWRDSLEQMGEEQVRLAILANDGLGDVTKGRAYKWLEEKARETKRRNEAIQAEQNQIARTAKNAAIVAAVAAIIGIVVTLLAWLFPLR